MTKGRYYKAKFTQFIRVLGLDRYDANRPKIHLQPVLPNEEMRFMYPRNEVGNAGKVTRMYTYYSIMNRLLRKTISQRGGNPSDISLHAKNLLARLRLGERIFVWLIIFGRKSSTYLKIPKRSVLMRPT